MHTLTKRGLSLEMGLAAVRAGISQAEPMDLAVSVAVADESGIITAFARMDGAKIVSVTLAQAKARTAVHTAADTGELYTQISNDQALLAGMLAHPGVVLFAGGTPVLMDGHIIGAVGVSGGSPAEDAIIATHAATSLSPAP